MTRFFSRYVCSRCCRQEYTNRLVSAHHGALDYLWGKRHKTHSVSGDVGSFLTRDCLERNEEDAEECTSMNNLVKEEEKNEDWDVESDKVDIYENNN